MEYNVYCDETNHLKINNGNYMAIVTSYLGNESWFLNKTLEEYNKYKK